MIDYQHILDHESRVRRARMARFLIETKHHALLDEYNLALDDIHSGVSSARGHWHAMSEVQRKALRRIAASDQSIPRRTLRPLMRRGLIHWDGPTVGVTERGRFVLEFGPPS